MPILDTTYLFKHPQLKLYLRVKCEPHINFIVASLQLHKQYQYAALSSLYPRPNTVKLPKTYPVKSEARPTGINYNE